ncbi:ABC-F type ribosomal protection protein [Carnobacterium viridans]|uniref:ATPase components of ABC transporters with duplicated ATPase domains n=1 Tax=Carnobacterium viridans TaxID=174587 RepID=A0A1H1A7N6_9LACT|nr:ABC-F type ribosomal protection protein [Carnobacterium viridans]UDE94263.1 ABC-F type ribosomal protection protein [Carnobacterium viridans]SDQ35725.1 ATPase components of ABC transporters with duplicated ATPase domains [Carnobacterium viridans]
MSLFNMKNVTQSYGANTIFSDLSLDITTSKKIGLIGQNGEGKTTLLKLIAGIEQPSNGMISWQKNLTVGMLAQLPKQDDHLLVYKILAKSFADIFLLENKMEQLSLKMADPNAPLEKLLDQYGQLQQDFEELGGYEVDASIRRVTSGLHIDALLEEEWKTLSGGERTKVGLAKILLEHPDLLLLDEPTNHLDILAIEWLTQFVKNYDGAIIIVSHDRYFLDDVVQEIVEIEQGELHYYFGNYSDYVKEREKRLLNEFQEYQDQQKKIKKMKESIKRLKEWANRSNPPSDAMHRRAKNMEKALARIELVKKPLLEQHKMEVQLTTKKRSSKNLFQLNGVSKHYGEKKLFENLELHVHYQDRIAIVGANGTGKSTLLNLLLGKIQPDTGSVEVGSSLSIGYLSQHAFEMSSQFTVIEEFRDKISVSEGEARHILAKFLFYGQDVFKKMNQLSGGERMRLRWAQLVHLNHNVLILDEPTNHLDIDSKEMIEEALSQFKGTIIAVSHDRYFLDKFFDTTYLLQNEHLVRYLGNYSYVRSKLKE